MSMRPILTIGVIVNSALYLGAVIGTALYEHNFLASRLGIAAIGVTYLAYNQMFGYPAWQFTNGTLVWLSIALGVFAGLALL